MKSYTSVSASTAGAGLVSAFPHSDGVGCTFYLANEAGNIFVHLDDAAATELVRMILAALERRRA